MYAGKVGTGFDDELLTQLPRKFAKYKRPDSPLENPPREKDIQWLRPQLVAEVEFTERTDDGVIRQGSFMGLREDIPAKSVGLEKAQEPPDKGASDIRITNPTRIIYPALKFTKADLARYYAEVSEWMLPHVVTTSAHPGALPRWGGQGMFLPAPPRHGREPGRPQSVRPPALVQREVPSI